ncbi:DUF3817 domain-containing protein [Corynebacterium provencense]|jgi:integral membrane protein|uniref:DUF3817 domain-containing protein n=1 Tax=Corynebacterium provencense TaxID=1737425 RepID=UPI000834B4A4|nr:DUF3817 domain-containing protein [Corynebacterium provencense]MCI1256874.1 DUF3817 domain-containing protein [Corynebacterium provencense]
MKPQKIYRIVADIEAVTWALLIFGMLLKYAFDVTEVGVKIAGPVHGLAFISFIVLTVLVWANNRWSPLRGLVGLASAVLPFCTVPFERSSAKAGALDGDWRADNPLTAPLTGHPRLAAGVLGGGVLVIFAVMLVIGGPFG